MYKKFRPILNFILICATLLITATACVNQSGPSIYGQWQGVYNNDQFTMVFQKDNTVTLSISESEYTGTFILDLSTSPMNLDLTFADLGTIQTIIEFVDENTLRFENNSADIARPTAFSDYATLTRDR